MKLTNRLGLPQPLVKAVANDSYVKGECDISVTSLLKPPQILQLEKRHEEEITEDVSDRIWSLLGQVVHGILERAEETAIAERRLYIKCKGWTIGGAMDRFLLKEGLLQDYKFTSVYKIKDGVPEDFAKQLNIYAHILRANGEPVKKLEIVAILRDWTASKAAGDSEYPQHQVVLLDVPIIDEKEVAEFIEGRVVLHQKAASLPTDSLPTCSKEERWVKDEVWAIMKKGAKKAAKLCLSQAAAGLSLETFGKGYEIVHREGRSTRCELYCSVRDFCSQYKKMKEGKS